MLAAETQEIAEHFKQVMIAKYGAENTKQHFADTRDTLCYATNENQDATYGLLQIDADMAVVVGGYNSSNTSHLVELLEQKFPTYFISSDKEISLMVSICWNGVDQLQILRSIKTGVLETSSFQKTGSQLYNNAPCFKCLTKEY